jgi:hypothetical protein
VCDPGDALASQCGQPWLAVDPRLVMHLAPYAAFTVTLPVATGLEWALGVASRRPAPPGDPLDQAA